jgi:hypothetical protein
VNTGNANPETPCYAPTMEDATGTARRALALTVWQPWATLLMLGLKDVENRSWLPGADLARGDFVLLHAGKTFDADAWRGAGQIVTDLGVEDRVPWMAPVQRALAQVDGIADRKLRAQATRRAEELAREAVPHSAIVGVARYAGAIASETRNPWFVGPHGWRMVEPTAFEPVPCNGAPGLFAVDKATWSVVLPRWTEARFG